MALPLTAFWSANKQIDRLQAERAQVSLQVAASSSSGADAVKDLFEKLRLAIDTPAVIFKGFDAEKFAELAARNKQVGGQP